MRSRSQGLVALAMMALLVLPVVPQAAAQSPPTIEEYSLPNGTASIDVMCIDSQGDVWLAQSYPPILYRFDATAKAFERHEIPVKGEALFKGMSAEGSEYIWLADQSGQQIICYDVARDKFHYFTLPVKLNPSDVISDGTYLWVGCNMELARISIEEANTTPMRDYWVDKYFANIVDIERDRTGNIWFVEYSSNKVGGYDRMVDQSDPDNAIKLFPIPTPDSAPTCLDIDSQGRLWFIESGPGKLGMFDTSMNTFKELDMPVLDGLKASPKRLAVDGDDCVWLTDLPNNRIIKYYPSKGVFVPISLNGSRVYPTFIDVDGDKVWVLESGARCLALVRVDPLYGFVATPTPSPASTPVATPIVSPMPKPAPGLGLLAAIAALMIAKKARS
ncbi:virginiamycin B lyase family protein [Methanocella conradii]|uniref:virginiamycin B lyase family protein n=1 Tax=Methanocella conradii TaxID=1175444 RepID=UPI0024B33B5D|nr:lyase [Methanocella conradii]MDI6898152.1 lyase [Methanocella conradii]